MIPLLAGAANAADPIDAPCSDDGRRCEEIVVTASRAEQLRSDSTAPVQVVDREEIEASGATTVGDLLRTVPGIQVTPTHGGVGLRMQGLDPEHTLILIDGRPVAGRVDGTLDLDRIPVDDVERIEIVPGPSSALYGSDALGGVVNIITRRSAQGTRVDGGLRAGSRRLAEGDATFAAGGKAVSGGATADLQTHDGYDEDATDEATTSDSLDEWGVRGWTRARPTGPWTFDGDLSYRRRDSRGVDASDTGAVFDRRDLEESADGGIAAVLWPGKLHLTNIQLAGTLWRQQALSNQRDSDVQDTYDETLDRRAVLYLSHRWLAGPHLLVGGVDGTVEGLDSDRLATGTAIRERVAIYAQDDWRVLPSPRLSVSAGGRLDVDSQFGVHATPHLALRFDPVPSLAWRVSGGGGFRAPDFKELYLSFDHASYGYVVEGNGDLRPETSLGATTELRWTPRGPLTLTGGGWWNEVENLIDVDLLNEGGDGEPALYSYVNVDAAVTRGLNGGAALTFGKRLGIDATYTFTDARDRADDQPLDGRARHEVTGSVTTAPLPVPVSLTLRGQWVGPRPFTDGEGVLTWTDPYVWLDARLAWTVRADFTLEAGVRNALEARDDATLGLPPRTLYVGVRASGSPSLVPQQPVTQSGAP